MKRLIIALLTAAAVATLGIVGEQMVMAQAGPPPGGMGDTGERSFDPAKMQQEMLTRMQTELGATDEQWAVILPKLEAVMKLQQDGGGMRGPGGPGGMGGPGERGGAARPGKGMGPGGGSPETASLRTALESTTSTDADIESALKSLRTARAAKADELVKAREALRAVVNLRQEAGLVLQGILD